MVQDLIKKTLGSETAKKAKQAVKQTVGEENVRKLKQNVKYGRDRYYLLKHAPIVCEAPALLYRKFRQPGRHVFFGYYDIPQFDAAETRLLVHTVPGNANAARDRAELGYYDAVTGDYTPFSSTAAWCWQQGARLRWHPTKPDAVFYNDAENGDYVCREYDLSRRAVARTVPAALYDIDPTASFGLSLNFSRLQRLRPGYGYGVLPDRTAADPAPADDGIFYVDLATGGKRLLVSLRALADETSDPEADQHYVNHISLSPDGKRFLFFHIRTLKGDSHWRTRLCVYELETDGIRVLEETDRVSHYDWMGNDALLMTCWDADKKQYYCTYDVRTGEKRVLEDDRLRADGHPSLLSSGDAFVSDTYPKENDMQTLFLYSCRDGAYRPLLRLYSDARQYEEKRCDLHPRVSPTEAFLTVDTTCEGLRQVLLIKDWRE